MAEQRKAHGLPVMWVFPPDFPERLTLFQEKSGLFTRGLARLLGVNPDRIRKWKSGAVAPTTPISSPSTPSPERWVCGTGF